MYTEYLALALFTVFLVMTLSIGSLVFRYLNLRRTLEQIEVLIDKDRR